MYGQMKYPQCMRLGKLLSDERLSQEGQTVLEIVSNHNYDLK